MSEQLTNEQLDAIETRAREKRAKALILVAAGSMSREDFQDIENTLALVDALRAARTERGRVVAVTRHRDVTLTTYEKDALAALEKILND